MTLNRVGPDGSLDKAVFVKRLMSGEQVGILGRQDILAGRPVKVPETYAVGSSWS